MKEFDESKECYEILRRCFKVVKDRNLTIQGIIDDSCANTQASVLSKFANGYTGRINSTVARKLWNYFWETRPNIMYLAETGESTPNSMEFLSILLNSEFGNLSKISTDFYNYIGGNFAFYYRSELYFEEERVICSKLEIDITSSDSISVSETVYAFDRFKNRKFLTKYDGFCVKLGDTGVIVLKNEDNLYKMLFVNKIDVTGVIKEIDEINGFMIAESKNSIGYFHSFFVADRVNRNHDGYFGLFKKSGIISDRVINIVFPPLLL